MHGDMQFCRRSGQKKKGLIHPYMSQIVMSTRCLNVTLELESEGMTRSKAASLYPFSAPGQAVDSSWQLAVAPPTALAT